MSSVASTVLTLVLFATYLGIGALAHDSQFSLGWVLGSTLLVWAGPAQIILISTLGAGATAVQAAIAACTAVAPEPSVEIRMICAGPAQTSSVEPSTQPRLKWLSWASAPMPT